MENSQLVSRCLLYHRKCAEGDVDKDLMTLGSIDEPCIVQRNRTYVISTGRCVLSVGSPILTSFQSDFKNAIGSKHIGFKRESIINLDTDCAS